ncbi:MAG: glycosyltransferase family 39 protein [Eubacterium sp.]|nr:glycosyltransferase family 39 protein [Eubacterium sp.]
MSKIKRILSQHGAILLIMFLAACARLINLGGLPDGVYPDEAYNAYNTWSIMTAGIDSRGYHAPVYFVAWGSGMSVLYAYLALPLFHIFGASIAVFRLPQALISLGSVFAFYILGRELFDRKTGYFMAFALAINPWSIMTARFGLDCSLAPGMILFAMTFFVLGLKKGPSYFPVSAFFMAASLYSYVLTWIALPILLLMILLLYWKRIPRRPVTFLSAALLVIAAIPLLLFLAVNLDLMPEIATPFFSIPKLKAFRGEELDLRHFFQNIRTAADIILRQYDGESQIASPLVGAYYKFTTPFFLLGILFHVIDLIKNHKRGDNDPQYILLLWLISAAFVALIQQRVTMIHMNLMHIPLIFYSVYGIIRSARCVKSRLLIPACLLFFGISFVWFAWDHCTSSNTYFFDDTATEALEEAKNLAGSGQTITIVGYPTIQSGVWMWLEKPLPTDFCANVTYIDDPAWGQIGSYGQFRFVYSIDQITGEDVYILQKNAANLELLTDMGLTVIPLNEHYLIACPGASPAAR